MFLKLAVSKFDEYNNAYYLIFTKENNKAKIIVVGHYDFRKYKNRIFEFRAEPTQELVDACLDVLNDVDWGEVCAYPPKLNKFFKKLKK